MTTPSDKPYDLAVLGVTGHVGRQGVRALRRQAAAQGLKLLLAGRDPVALAALAAPSDGGAAPFDTAMADLCDSASLNRLTEQCRVVLSFAGPYAPHGENLVRAAVDHGTHLLDVTGETFWVRALVAQHHDAAVRAGVKIIPSCGYEVLPFELAVHAAARELHARSAQACSAVKILMRPTGQRITRPGDLVSAGTLASLRSLLQHDHTDSVRNAACLLPPGHPLADIVAQRNTPSLLPRLDEDAGAVVAPLLPAPWVNPPMVLRGVALAAAHTPFAADFQYTEAIDMRGVLPAFDLAGWADRLATSWTAAWPPKAAGASTLAAAADALRRASRHGSDGAYLAAQWAAAAAFAAPLAALNATLGSSRALPRDALRKLLSALAPSPGSGPRDEMLDGMGYELGILATGENGARLEGRLQAHGHPGSRSTPEMAVAAALGLARGTLGQDTPAGVVTPAVGLGPDAMAAMAPAGMTLSWSP